MMAEIADLFHHLVEISIEEKGVPHQGIRVGDDGLTVMSFSTDSQTIVAMVVGLVVRRKVDALIFGLDRTTRPGQGTEFSDVVTAALWQPNQWQIGVINYQFEPRIVRPWDWSNTFWTQRMIWEIETVTTQYKSITLH